MGKTVFILRQGPGFSLAGGSVVRKSLLTSMDFICEWAIHEHITHMLSHIYI